MAAVSYGANIMAIDEEWVVACTFPSHNRHRLVCNRFGFLMTE